MELCKAFKQQETITYYRTGGMKFMIPVEQFMIPVEQLQANLQQINI